MPPVIRPVWVTPSEVQDITGATVTDGDVLKAESVLDAVTGVGDLDLVKMKSRDKRVMKLAAAYQTAWMKEQFDLHGRHDVESISQEGGNVSARDELTFVLAPLAKLALRRTSWSGHRTLRVGPGTVRRIVDPVISDMHPWGRRI